MISEQLYFAWPANVHGPLVPTAGESRVISHLGVREPGVSRLKTSKICTQVTSTLTQTTPVLTSTSRGRASTHPRLSLWRRCFLGLWTAPQLRTRIQNWPGSATTSIRWSSIPIHRLARPYLPYRNL